MANKAEMLRGGALALAMMAGLTLAPSARAVQPDEVLKDPALEQRARAISGTLRCLVCQGESIDDSNAGLAKDLRIAVRKRLVAGDTDEQTVSYLVDRYGEFILLKPVFGWHTAILWLAPFSVLIIGAAGLLWAVRRRPKAAPGPVLLSDEEKAELDRLLSDKGKNTGV